MSEIFINANGLNKAVEKLRLPDETLQKIINRAIAQTARWGLQRAISLLGKATRVSAKKLKTRGRIDIKHAEAGYASIWLGLDDVGLGHMKPRKTKTGIKAAAGKIMVPGGFIAKKNVFKRRGKNRVPIDKQMFALHEHAEPALRQVADEVSLRLQENFDRAYEAIVYK